MSTAAAALPLTALADVADFVSGHTGMVLSGFRGGDLTAAAQKIMAKHEFAGIGDFLEQLKTRKTLLAELVAEVTVGETYFFREPEQFVFIHDEIVPQLQSLREPGHRIRAWSAGCATGEEAYSLAILFERMGLADGASILATDISPNALARAEAGIYGAWSFRGEGAAWARPHVCRVDGRFRLAARLRDRVAFACLNLAQDGYPTSATCTQEMDIILCRNVLIYLEAQTVAAVASRLHAALAPGGFLITGPSDPLLSPHAPFTTMLTPSGLVYRKAEASASATRRGASPAAQPAAQATLRSDIAEAVPGAGTTEAIRKPAQGPASQAVTQIDNEHAAASRVRAAADVGGAVMAAPAAAQAAERFPLSLELGFLHALLLLDAGRYGEAERALKRLLYLDGTLAVAQFLLGTTLRRMGNLDAAARAFRNARDAAARHPPDAILAFSDGETAAQLARAAATQARAACRAMEQAQ